MYHYNYLGMTDFRGFQQFSILASAETDTSGLYTFGQSGDQMLETYTGFSLMVIL